MQICYSLFRPAGADRRHRVPMIMHSHGWGGSRTTDPASFQKWLDAGYGVLSFDQRGFGESGGQAHVENPAYEGHDVRRLIALIADLPWVRQDGPGDPRLGAIGGSYGGGYQFLAAFESLRTKGKPVFDALAPEITWFDLSESLAPEGVVRTEWALALSAAALPSDSLPPNVYKALVEGAATGTWPDGSIPGTENMVDVLREERPEVARRPRPPARHPGAVRPGHHRLAVQPPAGPRQLAARAHRARPAGRASSSPTTAATCCRRCCPPGVNVTSDPCSEKLAGGTFADLALRFMNEKLKGRDTGLKGYGRYHLATPDSTCTTVDSVAGRPRRTTSARSPRPRPCPRRSRSRSPRGRSGSPGRRTSPATLTALGVNNRAFYGLARRYDARSTPTWSRTTCCRSNEPDPVTGEQRRIALPSVAVDVPAGQTLYVIATGAQRHVRRPWAAARRAPSCSRTRWRTSPSWAGDRHSLRWCQLASA